MPVPFYTQRLKLEELKEVDAAFLLELMNTPGWLEHVGDRGIKTEADAENYVKSGPGKSYKEFGFGLWRVSLKETETPIGICGLLKRETLPCPDIGFAFLPAFEGQGYALEAAQETLRLAKQEFSLSTVLAITSPANKKSLKLLEKLGMKFEKRVVQNGSELLQYSTV